MDATKRRRGWSNERGGVSSTWINTEERAGASTSREEQYSRAADTRRTLSTVGPSFRGPRADTGTSSFSSSSPRAGRCDSPVDRERRILSSRARRALPTSTCPFYFSFIFVPWHIRGHTRGTLRFLRSRVEESHALSFLLLYFRAMYYYINTFFYLSVSVIHLAWTMDFLFTRLI